MSSPLGPLINILVSYPSLSRRLTLLGIVVSRLLFSGHPRPSFTVILDLRFETGDIFLSLLQFCRRGEERERGGDRVEIRETTTCCDRTWLVFSV